MRERGRHEDLLFVLHRAVQGETNHRQFAKIDALHLSLGETYYELGFLDKAEHHFRIAVEKNHQCLEAYNNLAVIAFQQGKNQEAQELLEYVLAKDPQNVDARVNLSSIAPRQALPAGEAR